MSSVSEPLDFIQVTASDVLKWDREWAFYFRRFMSREWFHNLAFSTDITQQFRKSVEGLKREQFFHLNGPLDRMELLIDADEIINSSVGEIGCGAGRLGRQLGHLANDYLGIDYSDMAVHIAAPLSPGNCRYICLNNKSAITEHFGTRDIIVSRHFFIHNNFANAAWVLKLAKALLKLGGVIVADFYVHADNSKGPDFFRLAKDGLDAKSPSRVFLFSESDVDELAETVGFRICESTIKHWDGYGGPEARRFVRFQK